MQPENYYLMKYFLTCIWIENGGDDIDDDDDEDIQEILQDGVRCVKIAKEDLKGKNIYR